MLSNAPHVETPASVGVDGLSVLTVAELVQRRRREIDLFNATSFSSEQAFHAAMSETFGATTKALRHRRIVTRADAAAIVDMLRRDEVVQESYAGDLAELYEGLLCELRAYFERH